MIDLKQIREAAGISQSKLAQMCGVIRQTISNIECGLNYPSVFLAKQLGMILNIDWTLFFEDIKPAVITTDDDPIKKCLNCRKAVCTNCIG